MSSEISGRNALTTQLIESQNAITGFAARFVGHDEAEDIAQDVAVIALEASGKRGFSSEAHYRNWLYRVARNRCVSVLRKKNNEEPSDSASVEGLQFAGPEPEEQYLSKEGLEELMAHLKSLPPKQEAVVSLRHFLNLEYTEIADILGITVSAARQRNFRGLNIIRGNLLCDEGLKLG